MDPAKEPEGAVGARSKRRKATLALVVLAGLAALPLTVLLVEGGVIEAGEHRTPAEADAALGPDRRDSPVREGADTRATAADTSLQDLSVEFCAFATRRAACDPATLRAMCVDAHGGSGDLESAFQAFGPRVAAWLRRSGLPARNPPLDVKDALGSTLRRLSLDEELAPSSAFVVVGVSLLARDLVPEGLLRDIITEHTASCSVLAWQAYSTLEVTATKADLPFLRDHLYRGTIGQRRAAFAAMSGIPEARRELADFLRANAGTLEPGLAMRVPRALSRSGLIRDHDLLTGILEAGNDDARRSVLTALGRVEDAERPQHIVANLASVVDWTRASEERHALALVALGTSGASGERRLIDISRDQSRPTATRLLALEALSSERFPMGPQLALELLGSSDTVAEVQTATDMVADVPSLREKLVEALRHWTSRHPEHAGELRAALLRAPRSELRSLAE